MEFSITYKMLRPNYLLWENGWYFLWGFRFFFSACALICLKRCFTLVWLLILLEKRAFYFIPYTYKTIKKIFKWQKSCCYHFNNYKIILNYRTNKFRQLPSDAIIKYLPTHWWCILKNYILINGNIKSHIQISSDIFQIFILLI